MILKNYLQKNTEYFDNYNQELFCGMFLELYNKKISIILLFKTGSYTFLGAKSMREINDGEKFVNRLMQNMK